jgi:hypothetical protein
MNLASGDITALPRANVHLLAWRPTVIPSPFQCIQKLENPNTYKPWLKKWLGAAVVKWACLHLHFKLVLYLNHV